MRHRGSLCNRSGGWSAAERDQGVGPVRPATQEREPGGFVRCPPARNSTRPRKVSDLREGGERSDGPEGPEGPEGSARLQDLLDVGVLLVEDLPAAVVAADPEEVRVGGEWLVATDAAEHDDPWAFQSAVPLTFPFPAGLAVPGAVSSSTRKIEGAGRKAYASEAKVRSQRLQCQIPEPWRRTDRVEHFGQE